MAKIEDILTLKEAGFSASDIAQLLPLVGSEVEPEVKEEKPVEIPKEEPKVMKKEEDAINNDISAKLSELIEKIEANALLNTRQKEVEEKSAEDILANIIMPK